MGARRIDYDGMISVYDSINKTRPLEDHEVERVVELVRLKKQAEKSARYRARHADKLREKVTQYYRDNRQHCNALHREYNQRHPDRAAQAAKRWRSKNPEKVAAARLKWAATLARRKLEKPRGKPMSCVRCGSARIMDISGKTSDRASVGIEADNYDHHGYVPDGMNIGAGDYLDIRVCCDCGHMVGEWPIQAPKRDTDEEE